MQDIMNFIEKFPQKNIENQKIEDLLSYKENSIWWFFKNRLEGDHLPNQFPKREEIERGLDKKVPENKIKILAMRKALEINEKIKIKLSKKEEKELKTKNKILCLVPAIRKKGDYVDRIDKILKELDKKEDTDYILEFFEAQSKITNLRKRNLFFKYITKEITKKAKKEAEKINKNWIKIKKGIEFDTEKEEKIFKSYLPAFNFLFSKEMISSIVSYYETLQKLMKEKEINCVLLDSSGSITERVAIKAAKKLNIPCIRFLHGGLYMPTRKWDYPKNLYICIPNEDVKERLLELGAKEENIFLTGATFLEDLPEKKENKSENKQILFCTTSLVEESTMKKEKYFKIIENILSATKEIQKTDMIIKLHPSEIHKKEYEKIIKKLNLKNVRIIQKGTKKELYDLMNSSNLIITFYSTILLEANILEKPTILITHEELSPTQKTRFKENKAVIKLEYNKDPKELIKKYLFNKEEIVALKEPRKKLIRRFFYKLDDKMPQRVVTKIEELINLQSSQSIP